MVTKEKEQVTNNETYDRNYVVAKTTEYFNGDAMAADVWVNKYALKDGEGNLYEVTPDDMHKRIANELVRIENNYKNPLSYDDIYESIKDFKYIVPQGSPMAGIGNNIQYSSLSNCFVIGNDDDSYGGIMKMDEELVQLQKRRAGVGLDLSHLRPQKTPVNNSALSSTGAVSFMERFSNSTREVAQDGRRGALMETISIKHPDSEAFIDMKTDRKKVTGANVSVKITDEFMKAALNDEKFTQQYPVDSDNPEFTKEIDAKPLWEKIVKNARENAEPGILFWDKAIKESIPDCYDDIGFETITTNPSLKGDTLVLTDQGVYPIEFLANNKSDVKVMNYRGEFHDSKVFKSGEGQQLVKITFSNGTFIKCTKEHKWPILNSSGNLVNPRTGEVIKKEAKDINKKDKIYHPSFDEPINNPNSNLTEEDGFVLGWNQGDGWITYHKVNDSTQYGFIFSEEDIESGIGDKVLNYTNELALKESKLKRDKDTKTFTYCTTDNNVISKLENIGAWNKDFGIPKTVWSGNKEFVKGYIDGLFSSDGYVEYKHKLSKCRIVLVSSRTKLVNDVQKLLSFYGISSNIAHTTNNGYERYDLAITGIDAHKFSEKFVLSNNNKNEKLININKLSLNEDSYSGRKEYANNRDYLVVSDVEFTEEYEDVYDITVYDDTHTFITECGATGNCGEILLCTNDSCRLTAMNLYSFVQNPFTKDAYFDYELFENEVYKAQKIMDDIIDIEIEKVERIIEKIEEDPEDPDTKHREKRLWEKILDKCKRGRRTGLGVTAEGDMLAALDITYGTEESNEFSDDLHRRLKHASFKASCDMAKERGPFPMWESQREKGNPFLERIGYEDKELYDELMEHGRRNVALLTVAPTGSVSMMTQTTSGIEPAFLISYKRRRKINPNDEDSRVDFVDDVGDSWQEYNVFHHKFLDYLEANGYDVQEVQENYSKEEVDEIVKGSPYNNATSNDVDWVKKVELQGRIQQHVDHSISVTVNLPSDITEEMVSKVYETGWNSGCKGVTIYRDGSRSGVLVSEEEKQEKKTQEALKDVHAPKRPKRLNADIIRFQNNKEKWIAVVGLYDGRPYEIFTGRIEDSFNIPNNVEKGEVIKVKENGHSRYDLQYKDKDGYNVIFEGLSRSFNPEYWNYAKLISGALRHGMPLQYVYDMVESLNLEEDNLNTWKKGVCRVIKKYIPDGTKYGKCPQGEKDEDCGLVFREGCLSCDRCGISRCG